MTQIPDWLREFIVQGSNFTNPDTLTLDSTFEDAGFDALAPIELDCIIEERTGFFPSENEVQAWSTLRDVVASEAKCAMRRAA